eukprot:TRINITY_DN112589_c0_g1_i1.p1 TRINITY_DN112589_c0_g1~~TRINITY_DN112589_c0_g1_i1.p1  ORF type:complete len:252 (-),score=58.20 TRINITY_DN112589_c0_g1_i1:125-805(-)
MYRMKEQQQASGQAEELRASGQAEELRGLSVAVQPQAEATNLGRGLDGHPPAQARSVPKAEASMFRKLSVCVLGGILMGLWNPLVALAEKGLSPFGEFLFFTLAILLSSIVYLPLIVCFPLEGGQGGDVREVLAGYKWVPRRCHLYSFLGGTVWAVGTLANAVAGASEVLTSAQSYAIGQCTTVLAIFWGMFLFNEFKGTDWKVKGLIVVVLGLFLLAVILIASAS